MYNYYCPIDFKLSLESFSIPNPSSPTHFIFRFQHTPLRRLMMFLNVEFHSSPCFFLSISCILPLFVPSLPSLTDSSQWCASAPIVLPEKKRSSSEEKKKKKQKGGGIGKRRRKKRRRKKTKMRSAKVGVARQLETKKPQTGRKISTSSRGTIHSQQSQPEDIQMKYTRWVVVWEKCHIHS